MSNIPRVSLEDTLSLLQLVREAALAQGRDAQAQNIAPVVEQVSDLLSTTRKTSAAAPPAGMLGQADFRTLLEMTQAQPQNQAQTAPASSAGNQAAATMDRNRMIQAMSQANMSDVDIARQFDMTREEVRLVLSLNTKKTSTREVIP
jgi:hypothetical protein